MSQSHERGFPMMEMVVQPSVRCPLSRAATLAAAALAVAVLLPLPPSAEAQDRVTGIEVDADVGDARSGGARSGGAGAEKSGYTLFDPTPRHLMRPLSSDRPDVTESPYTVDAGHFQVELSFFEYARDGGGAVKELDVLPFNLKVGLTNNVDLQLVVTPFVHADTEFDGRFGGVFENSESGFGPVELRAKINLWGNDGGGAPFDLPSNFSEGARERFGDSALAVMPYVRFPTGEEDLGFADEVEFGVIVPFATPLNEEWDLGLMAELAFARPADDNGTDVELLHTASFSRDLGGRLGGYGEYIGVVSSGARYIAALGVGLTYSLSRDAQLDAGVNVGITDEAEDARFFTGLTYRR